MTTTADRIINLIKEKREEINRNGYFTLTIKIQDGYPTIARIETSLKPAFKNDKLKNKEVIREEQTDN